MDCTQDTTWSPSKSPLSAHVSHNNVCIARCRMPVARPPPCNTCCVATRLRTQRASGTRASRPLLTLVLIEHAGEKSVLIVRAAAKSMPLASAVALIARAALSGRRGTLLEPVNRHCNRVCATATATRHQSVPLLQSTRCSLQFLDRQRGVVDTSSCVAERAVVAESVRSDDGMTFHSPQINAIF